MCIWNPANPQATASRKGIRSLLFSKASANAIQNCSSPGQHSREYMDCCQFLYSRATYKPGTIRKCGTIGFSSPCTDSHWPAVLEITATCLPFQGMSHCYQAKCHNRSSTPNLAHNDLCESFQKKIMFLHWEELSKAFKCKPQKCISHGGASILLKDMQTSLIWNVSRISIFIFIYPQVKGNSTLFPSD